MNHQLYITPNLITAGGLSQNTPLYENYGGLDLGLEIHSLGLGLGLDNKVTKSYLHLRCVASCRISLK